MTTATALLDAARDALRGRVVVVTGASSGIGRAFVTAMAPSRATFVLLARRADALEEVAAVVRGEGGDALVQPVDLRDLAAARAAAEACLSEVGAPDLLLANAGHSIARSVTATAQRPDSIARSVAVNYTGAVTHALPLVTAMRARGSGHLIGSSTANARLTVPGWGPYAASKAAWDAWLRTAAVELRPVATTILAFPLVDTAMAAPTRAGRRAMPVDLAAAWVARAVVRRPARIAPAWLPAAEVAHALAPSTVARLIGRFSLPRAQR